MPPLSDTKLIFTVLSTAVFIFAFGNYLRDMFRTTTKPHIYTWLIWTITQGIAVAGLWYGNGGWGSLALTISAVFVFLVFLFSLRYGTRNITKSDTAVLAVALLSIVVWQGLHNPLFAVVMASAVDVMGYLPSFRKTFEEPWSENAVSWAAFSVANILSILALAAYNPLTLTYLVAITVANSILLAICLTRRLTVPQPASQEPVQDLPPA